MIQHKQHLIDILDFNFDYDTQYMCITNMINVGRLIDNIQHHYDIDEYLIYINEHTKDGNYTLQHIIDLSMMFNDSIINPGSVVCYNS